MQGMNSQFSINRYILHNQKNYIKEQDEAAELDSK